MPNTLLVELPPSWKEKVVIESMDCDAIIEQRSVGRVRVLKEGTLTITHTPDLLSDLSVEDSTRTSSGVLVKDMSSVGIGFLYHTQLYPKEVVSIQLREHVIIATIRRSRFMKTLCYEHGAHIQCVKRITASH